VRRNIDCGTARDWKGLDMSDVLVVDVAYILFVCVSLREGRGAMDINCPSHYY